MEDSSWSWSCWINFWNLFLTIIMSLVQFFKLHQYIWPRGRLLCQNRCQQGTLYFRQSPDRAIHLSCQSQFLELKCFFEVEGAWYFEESLVQSKSCLINSTSIFFFCIKTFNFGWRMVLISFLNLFQLSNPSFSLVITSGHHYLGHCVHSYHFQYQNGFGICNDEHGKPLCHRQ